MLSQRAQNLKASPTLSLAAKAKELKDSGLDVISLSVGEPDWNTYPEVIDVAYKSMLAGQTKYTPASGIEKLKSAVAKDYNRSFGCNYQSSQVTVSAGAKFLLFSAFQVLLDPGDEVIIPSPYWVSYPDMVELTGASYKFVVCDREVNFKLSAKALHEAITDQTKLLILNSPSNPTGMVYSLEELKALGDVLRQHPKLWVVSDDIYNRLVFNDRGLAPHLLEACPDLADRCICVNGASKAFSMTGWRVGWALGPVEVIRAMSNYQSQSVSCASAFAQEASCFALENCEQALTQSRALLGQRKQKIEKLLESIPGLELARPDGAFYMWIGVQALLGRSYRGRQLQSSAEVAQALLDDQQIAVVPGEAFGLPAYLRISYALAEERAIEACRRLQDFCQEVQA